MQRWRNRTTDSDCLGILLIGMGVFGGLTGAAMGAVLAVGAIAP
ncbi:MAG: hypothetical protein R3B08_01400 [Nitrospira sp.]